jgi:hypothetical protein
MFSRFELADSRKEPPASHLSVLNSMSAGVWMAAVRHVRSRATSGAAPGTKERLVL